MVEVGDSGSPLDGRGSWDLANLAARVKELGIKPKSPLDEALAVADQSEVLEQRQEQRNLAQQAASAVMGYKPITVTESVSVDNVKTVEVSDIKTFHNLDIQAAPAESTLELKPISYGSEKLVKIHNRIFDREIIRNETGTTVTQIQDEIKLPESSIKLEVSISNEGKTIKIFENGKETEELKFTVQGEDDNQRVERPSFSEPSLSGDRPAKVFFHKRSLSPYQDDVETYEYKSGKYKLLVDKGIITIRDNKDSLVFLQDGEGRNYIFHPESVSDTGFVKSKQELESSMSPAAYRRALDAREKQILDTLELFEKKGNPSEMLVRFSEPNSQGETEIMISKSAIDIELLEIQRKISEASLQASKFLMNERGHLEAHPDQLKMLQTLLGFSGSNAEVDPATVSKADNLNILNSKQTVAMFAGLNGEVQYFNGQAKSLYGINP
jgi:hypothetical protein